MWESASVTKRAKAGSALVYSLLLPLTAQRFVGPACLSSCQTFQMRTDPRQYDARRKQINKVVARFSNEPKVSEMTMAAIEFDRGTSFGCRLS